MTRKIIKQPTIPILPPPIPNPPDPGPELVKFIAWLKKRGGVRSLLHCQKKYRITEKELEEMIEGYEPNLLCIYRTRDGGKAIVLENKVWADQWLIYYKCEVPHHRHYVYLEQK